MKCRWCTNTGKHWDKKICPECREKHKAIIADQKIEGKNGV